MSSMISSLTNQSIEKQEPLVHILEKQAKEFEEFGKRMSVELQSSYQDYIRQHEPNIPKSDTESEVKSAITCECKEKTKLINSMKARIEELESESIIKNQEIKKLQIDVQSLFDMLSKKGITEVGRVNPIPTQITITSEIEEDNQVDIGITLRKEKQEIEKDRLSVKSFDIKNSYSDSALDLFTDDDDYYSSSSEESIKTEPNWIDPKKLNNKYDKPSEWLDVSPTLIQERIYRAKSDKKNLDRWNSKMASNGLLPISLVGKVDAEKEKKIQTHRKRHSTSAIWVKTYENKPTLKREEKFKMPSFKFPFNTTDDNKTKQKEIKDTSIPPISLKSSVSTSIFETSTTTSLISFETQKLNNNSKAQQMLALYK
ncbi:3740_t:CDS:1 [Funneliformis geosporum]|uniref:824_t:CDS:1 n=1 Tax=Funneliformis geosporum TaxID=1117311 RepID=A0A9W4SFR5_9GLOM|nr:3740_t:CDS:1 [Funneliformis geosporum]CAI2165486.1 824_t:CDS:1 [Funneliformis geosporum]